MKMAGEMKVRLCGTFPVSIASFHKGVNVMAAFKDEGQGVRDELMEEETGLVALGQTL